MGKETTFTVHRNLDCLVFLPNPPLQDFQSFLGGARGDRRAPGTEVTGVREKHSLLLCCEEFEEPRASESHQVPEGGNWSK